VILEPPCLQVDEVPSFPFPSSEIEADRQLVSRSELVEVVSHVLHGFKGHVLRVFIADRQHDLAFRESSAEFLEFADFLDGPFGFVGF